MLFDWLVAGLKSQTVVRLADALAWTRQHLPAKKKHALTRQEVSDVMRSVGAFQHSMHQQRAVKRYRKWRPVLASSLGSLHGDIAYFPMSPHYHTPLKYRAGCLVMVDVLSRLVYLTPLHFSKDAHQMTRAFERVFAKHALRCSHPIRSISFDQERTVMGKQLQNLLRANHIHFVKFSQTSSKAKLSENTIHRLRAILAKLNAQNKPEKPWWVLLDAAEAVLNNQPVTIDGNIIDSSLSPINIDESNVDKFIQLIYKHAPAYYFSQFSIDPSQVNFKFNLGDLVKAKLLVTSSKVIGEKRSAQRLGESVFKVIDRQPVVYRNLSLGQVYVCQDILTGQVEHFDEHDIVSFSVQEELPALDLEGGNDAPSPRYSLRGGPR